MRDSTDFETWLVTTKGLSEKSSKDVASRLRRAHKLVNFKLEEKDTRILQKLAESKDFLLLSVSIRSQVRRSIKLAKEMLSS